MRECYTETARGANAWRQMAVPPSDQGSVSESVSLAGRETAIRLEVNYDIALVLI